MVNQVTFNYTGSTQTWVVPAGVTTVSIESWGAEGGRRSTAAPRRYGGYVKGDLSVTPGETLRIHVGQRPNVGSNQGGWNGGGLGGVHLNTSGFNGMGGGGASDVRQGGTALSNRVIVAGGAGGTSSKDEYADDNEGVRRGGHGGANTGERGDASASNITGGYGGTQSAGGSHDGDLGTGGGGNPGSLSDQAGSFVHVGSGGGGGGGYYGGGGGGAGVVQQPFPGFYTGTNGRGGGGGSNYVGGVTNTSTTRGVRQGHGQVRIEWGDPPLPDYLHPQSTLSGVHDAAVQLSDGSTAYLESDGITPNPTIELKHVDTSGNITVIDEIPTDSALTQALKAEEGLQNLALVADDDDNLYVIGARGNHTVNAGRFAWENTGPGTWGARSGVNTVGSGVTSPTGFTAVWCAAGAGENNLGRILTAFTDGQDGTYGYLLFDASLEGALNVTSGGTSPSWLVSSSDYRNSSTTGLSLTTDVFGSTRVMSLTWAHDVGITDYQVRGAVFDVIASMGSSISNITVNSIWPTITDSPRRFKALGAGANRFVAVLDGANSIQCRVVTGTSFGSTQDNFPKPEYWDAIYDEVTEQVWIYSFDDSESLLRTPFDVDTASFGTLINIDSFLGDGVRDFIRTVKQLRDIGFVEVHWNRTEQ
jgi:hypothetical protein